MSRERKVIEYCVIDEEYLTFLENKVNKALAEGWHLRGQLIVSFVPTGNLDTPGFRFSHAMVKYDRYDE